MLSIFSHMIQIQPLSIAPAMNIRPALLLVISCLCLFAFVNVRGEIAPPEENKLQVEAVLKMQADAWNAGNIEAFMDGYAKHSSLRFASGGNVTYGWQETLDRYKQHYPNRAAMGMLTFTDLDTTILSTDAALVFGRWRLKTDKGEPNGLFTLLFRKRAGTWRIVADHTSAASQ